MIRTFLVLSVLFLAGCSQSLDLQLDPEVDVFLFGAPEQSIRLTPEDKAYVSLNQWLRDNQSDWYSTAGRYPGGVYLTSGGYGIQVTETKVIIYNTSAREPKAIYIQEIGRGDLRALKNIGQSADKT